jgi:ssDNA-binding replication factor A large subunit
LSADFKKMMELLRQQRPDLNHDSIRDMIDEKKRKIGAGYLTDQGALFLVAADLGVSFENVPKLSAEIKDLYIGAKDITLTARILNVYPIRKFLKKDSNVEIRNRTLTVYDQFSSIKVKLWDDQVDLPDEMNLQTGKLLRITKAYVKSGLDGKPIIHLSSNSTIDAIEQTENTIPSVEAKAITIDDVTGPQENVVIIGNLDSSPRISNFNNPRGESSRALQMELSNDSNTRTLRVVIWNIQEDHLPKVFTIGTKMRLVGTKIKMASPQFGNGDLEIHGDEGTLLEFREPQTEIEVMQLRLISIGKESTRGNTDCLALERNGNIVFLVIDNSLLTSQISSGTIMECVPSRVLGSFIMFSKEDSYLRVVEEDPSFPQLAQVESKIKDIRQSEKPVLVEAIVLQAPNTTDVNTKYGSVVSVADTLLGDDTGEIRLVGWRDQSSSVNNLKVGDRIKVIGAFASSGLEGKIELTLKPYSSVLKVN